MTTSKPWYTVRIALAFITMSILWLVWDGWYAQLWNVYSTSLIVYKKPRLGRG